MNPRDYDRELEALMDRAALRIAFSPDAADRRQAMDELAKLKRLQRPERMAELEQEKNLS